jgi:cell division transport system permease protein
MSNRGKSAKKPKRQKDPYKPPVWQLVSAVRDHRRVAVESVHHISSRLGTSFLVWLLVGIALALPAGLWILQINMQSMAQDWQGRPGLSVYFANTARARDIDEVVVLLEQDMAIQSVTLTTADEALEEFKHYSELGDALELLDENPLPASIRASLGQGLSSEELTRLSTMLAKRAAIADVVIEKTWLERLNDLSRVVSRLGIALAVLFGVGAVLVTASSVRLAIESRLEELKVLQLVGGTRAQMRRPFLYFGALYGFGGGVIAAMLISVSLVIIEPPLSSLLGSYRQELNLSGFSPMFLGSVLLVGGTLGILGAIVAVRQRLRGLKIV